MNAGITEEVGSTARSFMSTMGSQPVMLGMVIVVLSLIGMLWFTLRFAQEARKTEFEMIFAAQKDVRDILAKCIIPDRRTSIKDSSTPVRLPLPYLPPLVPLPTGP